MCSCNAPYEMLKDIDKYLNIEFLPDEIIQHILSFTKQNTYCPNCMKIVATSINSVCYVHCKPFILCKYCEK